MTEHAGWEWCETILAQLYGTRREAWDELLENDPQYADWLERVNTETQKHREDEQCKAE